jgi:hypothetical protein
MFSITLRRPLVTLAITAGLLAAAGSASASQAGPQPPRAEAKGHPHIKSPTHRSTKGPAPMSYTLTDVMISS